MMVNTEVYVNEHSTEYERVLLDREISSHGNNIHKLRETIANGLSGHRVIYKIKHQVGHARKLQDDKMLMHNESQY
jgi:hypothetical protein